MSVGHFLPIALILLLVSCATAGTTNPRSTPSLDQTASRVTVGAAPSEATSLPGPSARSVGSPTTALSPVGESLASAQADFDCDGRPDQLQFFARPAGALGDAVILARLTLATGAIHETTLGSNDVSEANPLIGIADVNGDGCADAIVTVGRGASTTWTSFLVYDGSELRQVQEDGKPATFLFGGSVRHGNSIECRTRKDATEIVARAVSDYTSDLQWDAVEDVHHWSSKSQLVLWSTSHSVILVSVRYAMPNDQDRYWGLSCGSVKLAG
jgi:hypothetical protein